MSMSFPIWFAIWLVLGHFWPVTLVAAGLLAFVAVRWAGVVRILSAILSCVLILCVASYGYFDLASTRARKAQDEYEAAERKRLTVTLITDTVVENTEPPLNATGTLPAGTTVEWNTDKHDFFYWADLHSPARFAGVLWQGHLEHNAQGFWSGTLSGDQTFGSWHCKGGGNAQFDYHNELMSCILAQDYHAAKQIFPAGFELESISQTKFTVPEGGVLYLSEIGLTLIPHQVVYLDESGHIGSVTLNPFDEMQPDPVLPFRGVPLHSGFEYAYAHNDPAQPLIGIRVELRDDLNCVGRTLPIGTEVILPLTGDSLTLDSEQDRNQQVPGCLH
jgi:hypothetical protein